jgi:acyl-CoA synthetase (NDP forming)
VLKLYSLTITHKTDVGGVQLNLRDAAAVKTAFQNIKQAVTRKLAPSISRESPCSPWPSLMATS